MSMVSREPRAGRNPISMVTAEGVQTWTRQRQRDADRKREGEGRGRGLRYGDGGGGERRKEAGVGWAMLTGAAPPHLPLKIGAALPPLETKTFLLAFLAF